MNQTIESTDYSLIIDNQDDKAIFVFVGRDPAVDQDDLLVGDPVILELLPPSQRFGRAGGVAMGRPVLARWPVGVSRFRQFLTTSEMEAAGWEHVPHYRLCDCWEDYYFPWHVQTDDKETINRLADPAEPTTA